MTIYRKVLRVIFDYYGFDPRGAESLFVHCNGYIERYKSWGSKKDEYNNLTYLLSSLFDIGYQTYSYGIYALFKNDLEDGI